MSWDGDRDRSPKLYQSINLTGLLLLVAGGLAYSVGSIFYSMKSKNSHMSFGIYSLCWAHR